MGLLEGVLTTMVAALLAAVQSDDTEKEGIVEINTALTAALDGLDSWVFLPRPDAGTPGPHRHNWLLTHSSALLHSGAVQLLPASFQLPGNLGNGILPETSSRFVF